MKLAQTITRYEVRTKGDGEFDYLVEPYEDAFEILYDPQSLASAELYAAECGGYVVKITEETL
jgi:hypothetical protein